MLDDLLDGCVDISVDPIDQDLDDAAYQRAGGQHWVEAVFDLAASDRQGVVGREVRERMPYVAPQAIEAIVKIAIEAA